MAQKQIMQKKLPTVIGLFVLIIAIAGGIFLVKKQPSLKPSINYEEISPNNIKLSNINTGGFTVSFQTKEQFSAYVLLGNEEDLNSDNTNRFWDNRDQLSGTINSYQTHYITVANGRSSQAEKFQIEADQKYYFNIIISKNQEKQSEQIINNNGRPFQVKTASQTINKPADIISGAIIDQNNKKIDNALVYLFMPGASALSDLNKEGRFIIPLNTAYSEDLSQAASYDSQATLVEFLIQKGSLSSQIKSLTAIKNLPEITLGENYDLTDYQEGDKNNAKPLKSENTQKAEEKETSRLPSNLNGETKPEKTSSEPITINYPSKNNETIHNQKPVFSGTGPAGKIISIEINSENTINASVTVNSAGEWTYASPVTLEPGEHEIYISYLNDNGELEEASYQFNIEAPSEETFLPSFSASPSASTVTPTLSPSPSPSLIPSSTPTSSPTPTIAPRSSMPSTESGVPSSGNLSPTFILALAGLLSFFTAIGLNYKYRQ